MTDMADVAAADSPSAAARLNDVCRCMSLDRDRLAAELARLDAAPGEPMFATLLAERPHLFAEAALFVDAAQIARMAALVAAIERVVALPAYQAHVLAYAPAIAQHAPAARGVFLGYDFHLGDAGPRLIEINTNAGGGLLNTVLARAQKACCAEVAALRPGTLAAPPEQEFLEMFRAEWALGRRHRRHRRPASADFSQITVAIVDDAPRAQYLYPEFLLFQRLFAAAGIAALICDPAELRFHDDALWHGARKIDLVYNRLTDFAFAEPASAALRAAYLADAAVVTPHPRAHALYADKRNLVALSDAALLADWGVDAETRRLLATGVPRTERVTAERAENFWARRRQLFFKPAGGFGARAAYRGDKLTRRVFAEILAGDYVAQTLTPPSLRSVPCAGEAVALKADLRNYVYAGQVQLVAARLWAGQTTNFRTPGGGFAPVLSVPDMPGVSNVPVAAEER